jgi:hypothetical protein
MNSGHPKPSFSPWRRWSIGLDAVLVVLVVFAVVVMVNYLSQDYYARFRVSSTTRHMLWPRTVGFVKSLTNQVNVIVYYDKKEPLYSIVTDLLDEYRLVNPRISIRTVDYQRDPAAALKLKEKYGFLGAAAAKDLVIFECNGRVRPVDGGALSQYVLEQVPNEKEREFRRKPVAFLGETLFTAALLDVANPRPLKAYFLQGHGEHAPDSADDKVGYLKFASVLGDNNIRVETLSLRGTNAVPMDCNLLIIAGPTTAIPATELERIEQYLAQGGRLLALLNFFSAGKPTGLEPILAKWGVVAGDSIIADPDNSVTGTGNDMAVSHFSKHPIVNPLLLSSLHLILPRSVAAARQRAQPADAPKAEEIAFSGPKAFAKDEPLRPRSFPLIVAVEKGALKGVVTERGTTRIVVAGDSIFLANHQIDSAANRDFAAYAANWLLERTQLLEGLAPRPMPEYRIVMTKAQLQSAELVLLGAMPGGVLLLGGLVWFRRRR